MICKYLVDGSSIKQLYTVGKTPMHIQWLYIKKLQAIHLMLYNRWCKKYKHELMY